MNRKAGVLKSAQAAQWGRYHVHDCVKQSLRVLFALGTVRHCHLHRNNNTDQPPHESRHNMHSTHQTKIAAW